MFHSSNLQTAFYPSFWFRLVSSVCSRTGLASWDVFGQTLILAFLFGGWSFISTPWWVICIYSHSMSKLMYLFLESVLPLSWSCEGLFFTMEGFYDHPPLMSSWMSSHFQLLSSPQTSERTELIVLPPLTFLSSLWWISAFLTVSRCSVLPSLRAPLIACCVFTATASKANF